jgi:hypothetical protein
MIRKRNRHELAREHKQQAGRLGGKQSQRVQAAQRLDREIDADTLRQRAVADARGQVLREGCTYRASGETHWQIVRSVAGRHEQQDVLVNGRLWRTGGQRKVAQWLH